jgi:hypothetical protein
MISADPNAQLPSESSPEQTPGASTPTIDGQGAAATLVSPAIAAGIERSSASAVDQHLTDSKRKRGPDKRPRKPRQIIPLEEMGTGPAETLLAEGTPQPLAGIVATEPTFDEETAREMVEIGIGLLNDGAAAIVRAIAKKETGDEKLATEAGESVRMSEKIEKTVKTGAVKCAKKYAVRMDYAPEIMLGGGLVIWAGQVTMTAKALRAKGAELRARTEQKEAA